MTALIRHARKGVAILLVVAAMAAVAAGIQPARATAPGVNGRIAFMRDGPHGTFDIYTVNSDGSDLQHFGPPTLHGGFPSYFAGGSKVAFISATGPGMGATVADPDATNQVEFPNVLHTLGLTASPDGTRFAGLAPDSDGAAIAVSNADGSPERVLFAGNGESEWWPAWSPDSSTLAFVNYDDVSIWIAKADGTDARRVTATPGYVHSPPSFSPDGKTLVFVNDADGGGNPARIYLVGVDGTDLRELPASMPIGGAGSPRFSPDGQKIVFESGGETQGIYTMNADGSEVQRITDGTDEAPDWQPITAASMPTTTTLAPTTTTTTTVAPTTTTTTTPTAPAKNKPPVPAGRGMQFSDPAHTLLVDADKSHDPDGTIVAYMWRWGDRTSFSFTRRAWHTYAAPGRYLVSLTVVDNKGATASAAVWVTIR